MSEPIRILLVDDHQLFRDGVKALFSAIEGFHIVAETESATEAIALVEKLQPDVVLLDIHLPDSNGIEATRALTALNPSVAIVIVTMFNDDDNLFNAIRAGARGFVLKGASSEVLQRTIVAASAGETLFNAAIAQRVIKYFNEIPHDHNLIKYFPELTSRERDILRLLAADKKNAAIATELNLAQKTVRNYISNIFSKLNVADRTQAILKAKKAGL